MAKRSSVGRIQELVNQAVNDFFVNANLLPNSDNSVNLGAEAKRFANLYTGDLHLRNDRGSYTIVEEEDYLSIRNHKNGKLYKFALEEIEETE